jgi:hypothetical protein
MGDERAVRRGAGLHPDRAVASAIVGRPFGWADHDSFGLLDTYLLREQEQIAGDSAKALQLAHHHAGLGGERFDESAMDR